MGRYWGGGHKVGVEEVRRGVRGHSNSPRELRRR